MLAHAFLAVTAAASQPPPVPASGEPAKKGPATCGQEFRPPRTGKPPATIRDDDGAELIALTVNEIRRLLAARNHPARSPGYHDRWSRWRRKHQARARRCHYQRRLTNYRLRLSY